LFTAHVSSPPANVKCSFVTLPDRNSKSQQHWLSNPDINGRNKPLSNETKA